MVPKKTRKLKSFQKSKLRNLITYSIFSTFSPIQIIVFLSFRDRSVIEKNISWLLPFVLLQIVQLVPMAELLRTTNRIETTGFHISSMDSALRHFISWRWCNFIQLLIHNTNSVVYKRRKAWKIVGKSKWRENWSYYKFVSFYKLITARLKSCPIKLEQLERREHSTCHCRHFFQ